MIKIKRYYLTFVYFVLFLLTACVKDKSINPTIILNPENLYFEAKAGSIIPLEIICSGENNLSRFYITSRPENSAFTTIFDTVIFGNSFKMVFDYKVPAVLQPTSIILELIIVDENGDQGKAVRKVTINEVDGFLPETSGHQIYSAISGKRSGFNLINSESVFPHQVSSANVSFKDVSVSDSLGNYFLSRTWISNTDYKFIKYNDFNYANATYLSLKQSYESGLTKPYVENIEEGDIILTRIPNSSQDSGYVAIKIIFVIDQDSTLSDSYIFSLKK